MSAPPTKLTKLYYLARVMSLFRDHMPYSPLGIFNIPLVAGNDMNMYVVNTLPGCLTNIDANIIAVGTKFLVEELLFLVDQRHTSGHLFRRQLKKTCDMALRNNHCMPRARRIGIPATIYKIMFQRDAPGVCTKQAGIIGISFLFLFTRQTSIPLILLSLFSNLAF